ncbi:MAG: NAD-dependent epimerase/dehydratase family protein, partial [Chlamydiota bacterium]
ISPYAATKLAGEQLCSNYAHLYDLRSVSLRFFTVYGPWGRPDMAYYSFTKAITEQVPIKLYNMGKMKRDFTYIDDIVAGTLGALDYMGGARVYNLGNHKSEELLHFVAILEKAVGKRALIEKLPMQMGEMVETFSDIEPAKKELGFLPRVSIEEGLPRFVNWYKEYYGA